MPSGHRVGGFTFSEICICIGYILPTFVGCCSVGGCLCALRAQGWVMYIFLDMCFYWIYSANNCGVLFTWGVSVCPSGTGLGDVHFLRYEFVLDKFCQHLWGVVHLGGIRFLDMCLYWIYSANNCGVLFTWGVSVCPSGTGLGHVQQKGPHNCLFW